MTDGELRVTADETVEIPLIVISYGPEQMFRYTGEVISEMVLREYYNLAEAKKNPSVIVEIQAETAGSPIIRALFNLHRAVTARKGQVFCVGYPDAFVKSLLSVGLNDLPGFTLLRKREDALIRLGVHPN